MAKSKKTIKEKLTVASSVNKLDSVALNALILGGLLPAILAGTGIVGKKPLEVLNIIAPSIRDKKRAAKLLNEATKGRYYWTGKRFAQRKLKAKVTPALKANP